jgi:nucleoside-diphosphate-sugar epimerase
MDGKVIVITGALGALGSVVADEALNRGARIASVDHAPTRRKPKRQSMPPPPISASLTR